MADRARALAAVEFFLAEDLGDEPHVLVGLKRRARAVAVTMPALSCPRCCRAKSP